jgi:hypothetical protein
MMRGARGGAIVPWQMSERRIAEPKIVLLAAGALVVMLLCIVAIADTGDAWLVVLTALAVGLIGGAIVLDLRRVIAATGDSAEIETPPGRAIIVSTTPMTAEEVLDAVGPSDGEERSIMVVCPAGLTGGGLMAGDHDYARAHRSEAATVAALRRAGINAAGQVGDRNPAHAVEDALALFPAERVVIVAHGPEADVYREHLDLDELQRRTRVEVRVRETASGGALTARRSRATAGGDEAPPEPKSRSE